MGFETENETELRISSMEDMKRVSIAGTWMGIFPRRRINVLGEYRFEE